MVRKKDQISPLLDFKIKGQPSYNNQFQTLPKVCIFKMDVLKYLKLKIFINIKL